jgi:HK97 family phage major capsid protein
VLPPIDGKGIGVPSYDTDPGDADWTPEVPASSLTEDDGATFGKRELIPHLDTKLLRLSLKLMRSSVLDVEEFIAQRLAYKFGITEEKVFLLGTGNQQPLGLFVADANGIDTSRDVTASASTSFSADDLISVKYSVKQAYQMRGTWVLSREAVKRTRKLKDGVGQYLWTQGLSGQPDEILDRPYVMSEYVPSTYTTGLYVALFGDISFYWIGDSLDFETQVLNELFALTNQVGLLARKETDGMPVLAEAFARLKLA